MQGSLYVAISSQIALERRLTTLADNVANANTTGFRATEVKFNEVLADTGVADVSFVNQGNDFLNTSNGGLKATGNQLDFAIRGDGGLTQDDTRLGAVGLFQADLTQGFHRKASLGIVPNVPPEPLIDTASAGLLQGYTEESNVNPVSEMSHLIMVSRAFENASAMMSATEDVFKEAIRTLGSGR